MIDHAAHASWSSMKNRCSNLNDQDYSLYGGRGIKVYGPWEEFNAFWADMGPTWFKGATIERIDGNAHYEPTNCRWATIQEQQRNRANNVMFRTPDGVVTMVEAAEALGMNYKTFANLTNSGWTYNGRYVRLGTRAELAERENST